MPTLRVAVVMCALACVANVATGATGFGSGILFHFMRACIALVDPTLTLSFVEVMWVLVIQNAVSAPVLLWAVRKEVNGEVACVMMLPGLAGLAVGTFLLVTLASATLKLVLGVTVMFAALWRWGIVVRGAALAAAKAQRGIELAEPDARAGEKGDDVVNMGPPVAVTPTGGESVSGGSDRLDAESPAVRGPACLPLRSAKFRVAACIAGAASGLLGGMFGISGPPVMVFVTVMQFTKSLARSTQTALAAGAFLPQVVFLALASGLPSEDTWLMLLGDAFGSLLGLLAGIRLYAFLTESVNTVFILTILSMSAATLITQSFIDACVALVAIAVTVGVMYGGFRFVSRVRDAPLRS